MLERVRQRLLDDAVGGEVDARRKLDGSARHFHVDGQARLAHLLEEPVELSKPRLGAEGVGVARLERRMPSMRSMSVIACRPADSMALIA